MYRFYFIGVIGIIKKFQKYKEQLLYILFGGLTTIVNIFIYTLFTRFFFVNNIVSNIYAWIASVLFAYITNKLFVFGSKSLNISLMIKEIISFVSCRLLSGVMDMTIMYTFVNLLHFNDFIIKIFANVFVVLANYFFSKMFVFKKEV